MNDCGHLFQVHSQETWVRKLCNIVVTLNFLDMDWKTRCKVKPSGMASHLVSILVCHSQEEDSI